MLKEIQTVKVAELQIWTTTGRPVEEITIIPLINILNEAYVLDISKKTKSQSRQAMKNGEYVGGTPPYGYKRAVDGRHKLVANEPAASIVRQIFDWAYDGLNGTEIARRLNDSRVSPPGKTSVWRSATVNRILSSEVYVGNLTQGKTKQMNYTRIPAPKEDWISVKNSHEAIVSLEVFDAIKVRRTNSQRLSSSGVPSIFSGKVYCAQCARPMESIRNSYRCVTKKVAPSFCAGNTISQTMLGNALTVQFAAYLKIVAEKATAPSLDKEIAAELQAIDVDLLRTQSMLKLLYTSLSEGVIDKQEFSQLSNEFRRQTSELQTRAEELQKQLRDDNTMHRRADDDIHILSEYAESKVLTREIVERFVQRLVVSRDGDVWVEIADR